METLTLASFCQIQWQEEGSSVRLWLEPFSLSGGLLLVSFFWKVESQLWVAG